MSTLASVVHPVHDLAAAKAIHTALYGTDPHTDQPYYVGFNVGGVEVALDPKGHDKGMIGPVAFFAVTDLDAAVAEVEAAGATVTQAPRDVGGGTRIALLADADGNALGLIHRA